MSENLIEWLKLLLLALVQGFTEILPISSSGHILVLENLMGLNTSLTFSVFLHLGSLLAVFIFFHREIKNLCLSFFSYIFQIATVLALHYTTSYIISPDLQKCRSVSKIIITHFKAFFKCFLVELRIFFTFYKLTQKSRENLFCPTYC